MVTMPELLKVNVAAFTVPLEPMVIAPPPLAVSERRALTDNVLVASVARLMAVPLNEALPGLVTLVPTVSVMEPAETSVSEAAEFTPKSTIAESSVIVTVSLELKLSLPKLTVPASKMEIAPTPRIVISPADNPEIVPVVENDASPAILNTSPAVSPNVTLVPAIAASPVTVNDVAPLAVSVTAPLDTSVKLPAVFVPFSSVAESSVMETLPVVPKVTDPKRTEPAAATVIAPPPVALKIAVPPIETVSLA